MDGGGGMRRRRGDAGAGGGAWLALRYAYRVRVAGRASSRGGRMGAVCRGKINSKINQIGLDQGRGVCHDPSGPEVRPKHKQKYST
jgi:hypothetical protein